MLPVCGCHPNPMVFPKPLAYTVAGTIAGLNTKPGTTDLVGSLSVSGTKAFQLSGL